MEISPEENKETLFILQSTKMQSKFPAKNILMIRIQCLKCAIELKALLRHFLNRHIFCHKFKFLLLVLLQLTL